MRTSVTSIVDGEDLGLLDEVGNELGQTVDWSGALASAVAGEGPLSSVEHDDPALGPFGPDGGGLEPHRLSIVKLLGGGPGQTGEERVRGDVAGPREWMLHEHENVELRGRARRFDAQVASPRRAGWPGDGVAHRVASAEVCVST